MLFILRWRGSVCVFDMYDMIQFVLSPTSGLGPVLPAILSGYDGVGGLLRPVGGKTCLAIAMQMRGTTRCRIAGRLLTMRPGMCVLLDPQHDVSDIVASPSCQVSGLECDWYNRGLEPEVPALPWGAWHPVVGASAQPSWSACLGREQSPVLTSDLAKRIAPFLAYCARTWWVGPQQRLMAGAQFLRLCLLLGEGGADRARPPEDPCVRAEQTARQQIRRGFDVTGMAAAAGMTRAHFTRRYTALRGHGPGVFLRQLRLEIIAHHLRSGQDPGVLAANLGFASVRHLAQFVSRASGTAWRTWLSEHGPRPDWLWKRAKQSSQPE